MGIEALMKEIVEALPRISRGGWNTIPAVCLTFDVEAWQVMAGGHPHIHIGEWGGDYSSWGATPEDALKICLRHIKVGAAG